jgi:hypothetical protein
MCTRTSRSSSSPAPAAQRVARENCARSARPQARRPPPAIASPERLHELADRVEQLRTRIDALPTRHLRRIEDLDARAIALTTQREEITERRDDLPEARWRLGREHDPNPVERAHLTGVLQAADHELDAVLSQRDRVARELGDPGEVRAKRDALQRTLIQLTREHTEIRDELAEREIHAPDAWVKRALGDRPDEPRRLKDWQYGVRHVARYRLQYRITDPEEPLGQQPETPEQRRHWRQTRNALNHSAERLSRETCNDLDLSIDPVE